MYPHTTGTGAQDLPRTPHSIRIPAFPLTPSALVLTSRFYALIRRGVTAATRSYIYIRSTIRTKLKTGGRQLKHLLSFRFSLLDPRLSRFDWHVRK